MHRIPKLFTHSSKHKNKSSNHKPQNPKLVRQLANNNIIYEPPPPSSSLSFDDQTSFRVNGIDGEFESICESLGFSGPDDFSIPLEAWEVRNFRSSTNTDSSRICSVGDDDLVDFHESVRCGIKGVRPPVLAPPQVMKEGVILGEAVGLSDSCSFTTTSNDGGDSSSTSTEPMSNVSSNGRFGRVITHWEKGQILGRGSFGSVYEGIADGGFFIAVKEVSLLDQRDQGRQSVLQLEQEIALLSQFRHENIVQYYGTDKDESNLYIFLELVTQGSLLSLYQKYNLQDSTVSSYTRQILHGLKYLHEKNVVHRDIKCANILVHSNGSVKLADFGLAKATKLNDVKSCKGTPFWMAPEVVKRNNQGYGLAADIWSLGCTVLEMLTRQIPYSPLESIQALYRIGSGEPPPVPDSISRDARNFILTCLQVDPDARPTATRLLNHPFVKRPLPPSSGPSSPYNSGQRL